MSQGTTLYNYVYQEYQGSKNLLTVTVNKPTNPGKKMATFYSATKTPSLGDVSLGEIPLGEGILSDSAGNPPKFRAIRGVQAANMFEFALDVFSIDLDSQWELLSLGTNMQPANVQPVQIIGSSS